MMRTLTGRSVTGCIGLAVFGLALVAGGCSDDSESRSCTEGSGGSEGTPPCYPADKTISPETETTEEPWTELFDGKTLMGWKGLGRPDTGEWMTASALALDEANEGKKFTITPGEGILVNGPGGRTCDFITETEHGSCQAHIEFAVTKGSNSGVYFMGRYEVQILDSFGNKEVTSHDCGGIYERWIDGKGYDGVAPMVNASKAPGEWQTYDVIFTAPKFDESGNKTANARFVKVVHNGKVVHENVELKGPTRGAMDGSEKAMGPLRLQGDHGPVAYRNLRIRPIKD